MRIELSEKEVAERGRELAFLISKLASMRRDKRNVARDFSRSIKEFEERILEVSEVVRTGVEIRSDQNVLFVEDSKMVS